VRNHRFLDQPLRDLDLPEDLMVLAVRKGGQLIVPNGDTRLEMGHQLTLLGPNTCVENSRLMLAG
jgi:Trk K+ transport system NAD-binding subunit